MKTRFLRLLSAQDKGEALERAVAACRLGKPEGGTVFTVDPASFSKVPNSPFSYWVDDSIRDLFVKLPPFESEGRTVRAGLQTSDDFRFVRAWWEVPSERRLDAPNGPNWREDLPAFQNWCRKRTREGKYWVPFAKGGEYSPYYSDIHLVLHWKDEGEIIKAWADPLYGNSGWSRIIKSTGLYFRPGLTWLRRTRRLCMSALPSGGVFSDGAQAVFSDDVDIRAVLAFLNSSPVDFLVKLSVGRTADAVQFMPGMVGTIPFPFAGGREGDLRDLANVATELAKATCALAATADTCPLSVGGMTPVAADHASVDRLRTLQVQCDHIVTQAFGVSFPEVTADLPPVQTPYSLSGRSIDSVVGLAYGRSDVRLAGTPLLISAMPGLFDPLPVCPPATLVSPDGLTATTGNIVSEEWLVARPNAAALPPAGSVNRPTIQDSEYPIEIPWNGILVDDADHPHDIVARMRKVLQVVWKDKAYSVEQEACQALGVSDLRAYIRSPSGFFQDHLSRYSKSRRKAPIYWPLSTGTGSYTVWLYYPRLTENTLYECVTNYVAPKIAKVRAEIESLRPNLEGKASAEQRRRFEELVGLESELEELRLELERVANLGYKPDLDDGVVICASPLHALFRLGKWQRELREHWTRLAKGDFDWAHLAFALWPERVTKACRTDKSFAIAHGLENLYEEPSTAEPRKKTARGRKKQ